MIDLKSMSVDSLAEWSKTFVVKVKEYASVLGVSGTELQKTEGDSASIGKLAEAAKQAKETQDPAIQDQFAKYKDMVLNGPSEQLRNAFPGVFTALTTGAVAGSLPRLMGLINKAKDSPGMTPEVAESMGIAPEKLEMLKRGEGDKLGWCSNFVEKIKEHKETLGIPDSDVKALSKDHEVMQHVEEQTAKEQAAAPDHPQIQDLLKYKEMLQNGPGETLTKALPALAPLAMTVAPGILPRLQGFVQKITHSDHYNDKIGRELGVTEPERPAVAAREQVGVGAREPQRPVAPSSANWLLPLLLIGLLALLTYAFWPKGQKAVPSHYGAGPLTISNVKVTPGPKEATIGWDTDKPTTGQIEYGKTPALELGASPKSISPAAASLVRIHALKVMGLESGTRYFYRVRSLDKDGNAVMSRVSTFQVP